MKNYQRRKLKRPRKILAYTPSPDTFALVEKHLGNIPMVSNMRSFWQNARELRDWWFVLIPLLLWIGWRTYREERRKVVREIQRLHRKR